MSSAITCINLEEMTELLHLIYIYIYIFTKKINLTNRANTFFIHVYKKYSL